MVFSLSLSPHGVAALHAVVMLLCSQVELNTISSSFGCLCTLVGQLHKYIMEHQGASEQVHHCIMASLSADASRTLLLSHHAELCVHTMLSCKLLQLGLKQSQISEVLHICPVYEA